MATNAHTFQRIVFICFCFVLLIFICGGVFGARAASEDLTWIAIDLDDTATLDAVGYSFASSSSDVTSDLHAFDCDFNHQNLILGSTGVYDGYFGLVTESYTMYIPYSVKGGYTYQVFARMYVDYGSAQRRDFSYQKTLSYYPDGLPSDSLSHWVTRSCVYGSSIYTNAIYDNTPVYINGVEYSTGGHYYFDYSSNSFIVELTWYQEQDADTLSIYYPTSSSTYLTGFMLNTKYAEHAVADISYTDTVYELQYVASINSGDEPSPYVPTTPTPAPSATPAPSSGSGGDYTDITDDIDNNFSSLFNHLHAHFQNVITAISNQTGILTSALSELTQMVEDRFEDVLSALIDGVMSMIGSFISSVMNALSGISQQIANLPQSLVGDTSSILPAIQDTDLYHAFDDLRDFRSSLETDLVSLYDVDPSFVIIIPSCDLTLSGVTYHFFDRTVYDCGAIIENVPGLYTLLRTVIDLIFFIFVINYILHFIEKVRITISGDVAFEEVSYAE